MAQTYNLIRSYTVASSRKDRRTSQGGVPIVVNINESNAAAGDYATRDWARKNFIDLHTPQTVTAVKTFNKGIKVGKVNLQHNTDALEVDKSIKTSEDVVAGNHIKTSDFEDAGMLGKGFGVTKDANSNTVVVTDILQVRKSAEFYEVIINQMSFSRGATVHSAAGCEITSVEVVGDVYRCYYDNKGGKRYSGFVVGDQARCQRFDAEYNGIVKYYWRVVVATGENFVDLAIAGDDANGYPLTDGAGIPEEGDELVQMGNRTDKTRQGVIVIASTPTPTILQYDGINSFELPAPTTKIAPNDNEFTGKVHIGAGSTGVENIDGLPTAVQSIVNDMDLDIDVDSLEFGKYNLLRNSGFTGDYLSIQLQGSNSLNDSSQLFSPNLEYWNVNNTVAQVSDTSASGVEVVLSNGSMSQRLKNNVVVGDNYVVSFRAKGTSASFSIAGVSRQVTLTESYTRYVEKFTAASSDNLFTIEGDATVCELQLERGSVVSAWGHSMWDNQSELAYYQSLQYLASAMKDGSTTILGGLILSQMIALGNYSNGVMRKITAGINGYYSDDSDVAFWAGGDVEQAIATVAKFQDDPTYQPTDEEWATMAKFVATHGGDIFLRGYIHALGGYFRGTVYAQDGLFEGAVKIADGKILLNKDGSGQLSNGALSWDAQGRLFRNYPDFINWRSLHDTTINFNNGGYYIAESYESQAFNLPTPPFTPYKVVLKAADAVAPNNNDVTIVASDGATFFFADPEDASVFYNGTYLIVTTNNNAGKGQIELIRNGGLWEVFLPSSMSVGGSDSDSDADIIITN